MAKRNATAVVQLGVRMREPLRAHLEKAAKRQGISLNAEIVRRLEQSRTEQDALGGPELRDIAILMAASFAHGARLTAGDRSPAEWLRDPDAYGQAVIAVITALLIGMPNATEDDVVLLFESVKGRILSRHLNRRSTEPTK